MPVNVRNAENKRNQQITLYVTGKMKEKLIELADEKSMNLSAYIISLLPDFT